MILSSSTGIVFLESVIYETVYAKYPRNQLLQKKEKPSLFSVIVFGCFKISMCFMKYLKEKIGTVAFRNIFLLQILSHSKKRKFMAFSLKTN